MKFQLKQHFHIEAARFLPHLPPTHPCSRTHGHSFKITLVVEGGVQEPVGWVMDYHEIEQKFSIVHKSLDHRLLNEVEGLVNPTSEYLAVWIYEQTKKLIPQLKQVVVSETTNTECVYPIL